LWGNALRKSFYWAFGIAAGTWVLTMLSFLGVMWRVWGLADANLKYALELGCHWGAVGACLLGLLVTTVPDRAGSVLKFGVPAWCIVACFWFFFHIVRSA
jgi:hypothetical protein